MKNKRYLVIGAGSFLGSSFFDHMVSSNHSIYGISNFKKNKNIINSDYSIDSLGQILYEINPDVVYDFKLSKVSSNRSDFNDGFESMFKSNQNIISSLKTYGKKIDLHLISTSKLKSNLEKSHPYLELKNEQEYLYKKEFSNITNLNIHRVDNVVGKKDLNFSRILPFFFGSALVNEEVKFSSLSSFKRNYLTIDQFIHNLKTFDSKSKTNINFNSVRLTNESIVSKAKIYLENKLKKEVRVYWNNGEDSFENYISGDSSNDKFFLDLEEITNWYITNKRNVTEKFNKFQGSLSK